jgi:type IV pilus assembly protein PilP
LIAFVEAERAKPAGHVKPLPQPQEYESYEYDSIDLRDPFVPTDQPDEGRVVVDNGIHPDLTRSKEELERYPLDSLRMVGTLNKDDVVWALVKDSDGTVHRVRAGNYMGQNYGKITTINNVTIELVEFVKDGLEGWVDRKANLAITN